MKLYIFLLINAYILSVCSLDRKQLAGPPSDFTMMKLPKPEAVYGVADSYTVQVDLSRQLSEYGHCWSTSYPVDGENVTISLVSPWASQIMLILTSPNSNTILLAKKVHTVGGDIGVDGVNIPSQTYELFRLDTGIYNLVACAPIKLNPNGADAYIMFKSGTNQKLLSHVTTFDLQEDRTVGIVIQMFDENSWNDKSKKPKVSLTNYEATLQITMPNGVEVTIPFNDDGMHQDEEAGDGIYGAILETNQVGYYQCRSTVLGVNDDGISYARSSEHIFPISTPDLTLTGLSRLIKSETTFKFKIFVDRLNPNSEKEYYIKAEVWGTRTDIVENYYPVAWIGGINMINHDIHSESSYIELSIDPRWIQLSQLSPPFQLRNVVVQDINDNALISHRDEIFVESNISSDDPMIKSGKQIVFDDDMFVGPRPDKYKLSNSTRGKLILVHGYCSNPVWPISDFTDAVEFLDVGESRSNDQFARLLRDQCDKYPSCGIVAHSQGGMAALHLKTFYWSGLDTAVGPRLIQSVGAPYQGCSLAGFIAGIGKMFGYGCGAQYDLTPEGASLWLSMVPPKARESVYYYTTESSKNGIFDSCVTAANLVLHEPNDGTCEEKYSKLDGGNFINNKVGWCHTGDMNYPPQCTDRSRNSEMNKFAAR
jgi:hypothetical protein